MAQAKRKQSLEDFATMALDSQVIEIVTKKGKTKKVPAIHPGFVEKRVFVPFVSPPLTLTDATLGDTGKGPPQQILAVASREEWLENMEFLKEDLHWLLKLPHQRFWCQVIYDEDLHKSLTSYLSEAPRYYDFHNLTITPEMDATLREVHKLVFLVYLRMSTYKESKSAHLNPATFGGFIYDKFLFDIPIFMDLCILYGHENRSILSKMIENIFVYQPNYFDDLDLAVPTILQVFKSIEMKLGLCKEVKLFQLNCPNDKKKAPAVCKLSWLDFQDTVLYLVDLAATLSAFLDMYSPACQKFHAHQAECRIANFYETVFAPLEEEIEKRKLGDVDNKILLEELGKRSFLAKSSLLKTFRDIIVSSCVQPLIDAIDDTSPETGQEHVENLLQILSTCLSERRFICDYESNFPFEDDLQMIKQTNTQIDFTRTNFIIQSIHSYMGIEPSEVQNGHSDTDTLAVRAQKYREQVVDEYKVNGIDSDYPTLLEGATASAKLTGVELISLVSHVQDMFPTLGSVFIEMCLEYYDYKPEDVINALLEESLPDTLNKLDRNMTTVPKNCEPIGSKKPSFSSLLTERKNVFDNDEMDVFSRNSIDTSKIHRGKKKDSHADIGELINDKESIRQSKEIYNRYEMTSSYVPIDLSTNNALYEDEYDDTYDDATVTWTEEPTPFDQIALGRKFTIPRVLRKPGYTGTTEEESDSQSETEIETIDNNRIDASKWSRNPFSADLRDKDSASASAASASSNHHPSRGGRGGGGGYASVRGKPKGQGQDDKTLHGRKSKEQHKGAYANHNRRAQSDRKRSRGMIPT